MRGALGALERFVLVVTMYVLLSGRPRRPSPEAVEPESTASEASRQGRRIAFIYDHVKDEPTEQRRVGDAIDARSRMCFRRQACLSDSPALVTSAATAMLLANSSRSASLDFGIAALASVYALWLRGFESAYLPYALLREDLDETDHELRYRLIEQVDASTEQNRRLLSRKAFALRISIIGLVFEATCFGLSVAAAHLGWWENGLVTPLGM